MAKRKFEASGLGYADISSTSPAVEDTDVECFGMVVGLPLRRVKSTEIPEVPIPLQVDAATGDLRLFASEILFGTLEKRADQTVKALLKDLELQIFADEAMETPDSQQVNPRRKSRKSAAKELAISVILYGPAILFDSVGSFISSCGLYLQHPKHCDRNVRYRNPQCLKQSNQDVWKTQNIERAYQLGTSTESEVLCNPIDMFAEQSDGSTLPETDAPGAIKTKLYKHQKQALSFMLQRERGWNLTGQQRDVWYLEKNAFGGPSYVNAVSGVRRLKPPPELLGGILSDAPGLGKGLSIIALLAASKDLNLRRPRLSSSTTTLLVVPKTLIQTWKDELKRYNGKQLFAIEVPLKLFRHVRRENPIRWCEYYGKNRLDYLNKLEEYDLVITTYAVVRLDWKSSLSLPCEQPRCLHHIKWERIVLDEAHIIREPSKSFAKSVNALEAEKRWAVTGTPIQNRLRDLFSLFKFLRCYPFDDFDVFRTHVVDNWKKRSDPSSIAKLKMLINCLSLRRPKTTIKLPAREDSTIRLHFSDAEEKHYREVQNAARSKLHSLDEYPQASASFMNALQWLNKLRLVCNHGFHDRSIATKALPSSQDSNFKWSEAEAQSRFDHLDHVGLAKCSAPDCGQDLSSALSSEGDDSNIDEPRLEESLELLCSSCHEKRAVERSVKFFKVCNHLPRCKSSKSESLDGQIFGKVSSNRDIPIPTKIKAVVEALERTPDDIKSVVFSSWTKTFDILQPQLNERSIRCVRLDGSLSQNGRANVVRAFRNDPGIKVLLATITCGGVGLDLTAASRAYIMEPQWNPMSESQALDRIHRLGQEKEVVTIRYIMEGTWEEKVLKLQQKKQSLADLTLSEEKTDRTEMLIRRLHYLRELVG